MAGRDWTENRVIGIDIKLFVAIILLVASTVGGFYYVMGEIEKAKQLPAPGTGQYSIDRTDPNAIGTWPPTKIEYQMKDQTSRQTLQQLQERVEQLEEKVDRIEQQQ